ncbi:MAG: hypothetical protein VXX42_05790 [SAR324 cluster bacterium]|nr:hypothetical protein [SAR324 cluster bacterium]
MPDIAGSIHQTITKASSLILLIQSSFIEGIPQVTVFIGIFKVNISMLEKIISSPSKPVMT